MKNLQLIPFTHPNQPMFKIDIDKDLIVWGNVQYSRTDVRIIQEFVGHGSSKTTAIYTQVSKKSLANSKSPLDYIIDNQNTDNEHITKIKT